MDEDDIYCPHTERCLKNLPFQCFMCGKVKTKLDFGGNVWTAIGKYVLFHCCKDCIGALKKQWKITLCSYCKSLLSFDDFDEIPEFIICPNCNTLTKVKLV